ncbi:MAG: tetratricopeptide repeat protein [Spirochaetaceae bacterium]|nr:MAG: tetratricopeptide repeat protein [Spirochaetaceae bacterium]
MKSTKPAFYILLTVFYLVSGLGWSQEGGEGDLSAQESEEAALVAPETKVEPVFPEENEALIFIEGEDAVSTNFTNEPILNFSCSKFRTLQLNRRTGLQGGRSFYATFVLYIEESGEYELWYGGTPPGPGDELLPSYASPFSLRLDGGETRAVNRENIVVVEQYAPSYYWNYVGDIPLEAGQHTVDFQVSYTRGYDGKFYFYLDCFFLVKKQASTKLYEGPLPAVFPKDMSERSIDTPFKPFEEYQIVIRDNPDDIAGYQEIAQLYSLVGDHLNALKYLKRAALVAPENIEIQLLTAKNQIWKGDVADGLTTYRSLLLLDPSRLDLWLEAAKVAAWTGRYEESIELYRNALEQHPDNIDLIANLGLAYQWAGEQQRADEQFQKALSLASEEYRKVVELAESYNINGVPERSINVLRNNIRRYPDRLELYLLLVNIYTGLDRANRANEVQNLISASFRSTPKLSQYLELYYTKESLRKEVIAGYEAELERQPDNLELRETLAQTYFWNGKRKQAIGELQNVLANHAFIEINQLDQSSFRLLEMLDRSYLYLDFCTRAPALIKERTGEINTARSGYDAAAKANAKFQQQVEAAREKDEAPPVPEGEDPRDALRSAEQALARALEKAEALKDKIEEVAGACEEDWRILPELMEEEALASETFEKIIKPIRWEWDRRSFVEELDRLDSVLADYVLGKIDLIQGQPDSAERRLITRTDAANLPRQYQTAVFRTLLWQIEIPEAFKVLETGQFDAFTLLPYWERLNELRAATEVSEARAAGGIGEVASEVAAALDALQAAEKLVQAKAQDLQDNQEILLGLYENRLVRSMYRLGENTYLIRNELGDFYLKEQNFPEAIRQYKQVLAIDPWDIETIYDLGTIYEWSGDWKQAMNNYQRVYWSDPLYENVSARYNQLARQHSDSFDLTAYTLIESSRLTVRSEASYKTWLSTAVGFAFDYTVDAVDINPGTPGEKYFIHDLNIGAPLNFYRLKLILTPAIGTQLTGDDLGAYADLDVLEAAPHAGMDFGWALGRYLYLNGGLVWGWKNETDLPDSSRFYSEEVELNLNTSLSFIKAYPFRYSSMRTYGKVEHISPWPGFGFDASVSNWFYSAAQELILGILRIDEPYVELNLLGSFVFESTDNPGQAEYYSPDRDMAASGGFSASTWIPVGEASSFNVGARAMAGMSWEAGSVEEAKLEVEGNIGLSRGDAYYYLRTAYSGPFQYDSGDYRSLYIGLGFSSHLPRLLAP